MNLQTEPTEGVQGAVRGDGLEPSKKSAGANRSGRRRDREVFRETEVCSSSAPEISPHPAEIRRDHAVDGLGLHPDVGLAIRGRICPALAGPRNAAICLSRRSSDSKSARLSLFRLWVRSSR